MQYEVMHAPTHCPRQVHTAFKTRNYSQAITGSAYTASTKPAIHTSPAGNVTASPCDVAPVRLGSGPLTLTARFSPLRVTMSADGVPSCEVCGSNAVQGTVRQGQGSEDAGGKLKKLPEDTYRRTEPIARQLFRAREVERQ
jgi:hypothetical protein